MNDFAQLELFRIHHAELRQAADHHRLETATRRSARSRRPVVAHLLGLLTRPVSRRRAVRRPSHVDNDPAPGTSSGWVRC